ncbi:COG3650 family protein [Pseudomonas sp. N040]|uniref:COG3650 family protein n=1 Tax=Pseudomonas sp. N040 TaxID=2785325 RepID=UPI0018A2775D|nr:hypothetical protein [Pseudomonas sp. N040]MBF7729340.1 hypothetical protein [Pseudomonas sp. N040]MBW7012980.1 hypothetical protein [Pseudomonas sp. N040]
MFTFRPLVFALLPLFAGCQMLGNLFTEEPAVSQPRIQGELTQRGEQLLFKPCKDSTRYILVGEQSAALAGQAHSLLADSGKPLFADLRGSLEPGAPEGQLNVTRLYKLQSEGRGCSDPNFKQLLMRASGNEPAWNINMNRKGLVLEQAGKAPLALPYVEEQLPDGRFNISTESDGLQLDLWLTPKTCTDSMTGSILHLTAELNLNGKVLRGCGAYGAMRND